MLPQQCGIVLANVFNMISKDRCNGIFHSTYSSIMLTWHSFHWEFGVHHFFFKLVGFVSALTKSMMEMMLGYFNGCVIKVKVAFTTFAFGAN